MQAMSKKFKNYNIYWPINKIIKNYFKLFNIYKFKKIFMKKQQVMKQMIYYLKIQHLLPKPTNLAKMLNKFNNIIYLNLTLIKN